MAREGFVVYHEMRSWLEPFGDAERGRLFTAMLEYSITGEAPGLSGAERFIWPAIRDKIDRDRAAYEASCRKNKENISKRYEKVPEPTTVYDRIPNVPTETKTKTETETKTKSPTESIAHARGDYGWVKLTDEQYAKLVQDLGQAEADRCIRYVDEAAQSTGNKNKWKDWNLTVRKCHRDGWGLDRKKSDRNTQAACSSYPAVDPAELRKRLTGV